ncbi:MAG: hypothetical protein ABI878_07700 [Acidobacteriota bacterium]
MTNSYDNQTLFAYLLGGLSDSELERLDEMTFTDGEFAEAVKIAEKDLVDSYVAGELSGPMREQFESHYMASPIRREKLAFARALDKFASHAANAPDPTPAPLRVAETKASSGWFKELLESLGLLGGGNRRFAFAAGAAMVVLLLLGGWLIFRGSAEKRASDIATGTNKIENPPLPTATPLPTASGVPITVPTPNTKPTISPTQEATPTPKRTVEPSQPTVAMFVLPAPLRGAGPLTQVKLAPGTQFAQFSMGLESNDYTSYRVELHGAGGGPSLWNSGTMPSRGSKTASLSAKIPTKLLRSQIYSFTVSGITKDGTAENIGDYSFRVIK